MAPLKEMCWLLKFYFTVCRLLVFLAVFTLMTSVMAGAVFFFLIVSMYTIHSLAGNGVDHLITKTQHMFCVASLSTVSWRHLYCDS